MQDKNFDNTVNDMAVDVLNTLVSHIKTPPMIDYEAKINEAASYILKHRKHTPRTAVILGSGLNACENFLSTQADFIAYKDIPYFPTTTVAGHKGQIIVDKNVLYMQGRFHYYEGYKMEEVTFPIRVMKKLGIEALIITNAAGGVNPAFEGGNLMFITDHINFMGTNPLFGKNLDAFGTRFPDMTHVYDKDLLAIGEQVAKTCSIDVHKGVYMAFTGPSYETPAEIKMAALLGASAVGMSSVPEAIIAKHCGMKILGISCITNMAAGLNAQALSHDEVVETGSRVRDDFMRLIQAILEKI